MVVFEKPIPTLTGKAAKDFIAKANNPKPITITSQQLRMYKSMK